MCTLERRSYSAAKSLESGIFITTSLWSLVLDPLAIICNEKFHLATESCRH